MSTSTGDRIEVDYRITGGDPEQIAEAIRVEQTIEFPFDLAPAWIQKEVVGHIAEVSDNTVTIAYHPGVAGGGLPQLLNLLWGNVSLFPGVRVTDLRLPDSILNQFRGPRFGVAGLRDLFEAPTRPLLCTAIKPMGSTPDELAEMAGTLATAGFDIIKDDHGLADQPWALWKERVAEVATRVTEAAAAAGTNAVYMPSMNVTSDRLTEAAFFAKEAGAGALLVLPGICGFDAMRALADNDDLGLPIMAHPSLLGSNVVNPTQGLNHGVLFGTIMRLAGADISIFPNYGGRFSFSPEECADIKNHCLAPLADLSAAWPSPGGGMTLDRIDELLEFYGTDAALLIGGALHRGDLAKNASELVERVHSF